MKKKFHLKIKNFNLQSPEEKRNYNQALFTEVAPKYNFASKALSFGRDRAWKKILIKNLPDKKESYCLDLACGTGDITFLLADKFKDGTVTGMDQNKDMINIAEKKSNYKNIKFKIGDLSVINDKENSFDIITGGYALRNSPDLKKTLLSLYKVMKNDAIAGFLDFSKPKSIFIQKIEYILLKLWGNFWGLILHRNPEVYGYIAESLDKYPDREKLKDILEGIGFKIIKRKLLFLGILELLFIKPNVE